MTRARKTPGRIAFVGSGPGDTGLLTVRAHDLLTRAELVVTDPDVPSDVLATVAEGVEVRPAVGESADVAKDLVNEAKNGATVVRLVAGDPLTLDSVVTGPDGRRQLRRSASTAMPSAPAGPGAGDDQRARTAADLGNRLADELLASGAAELADLGPR